MPNHGGRAMGPNNKEGQESWIQGRGDPRDREPLFFSPLDPDEAPDHQHPQWKYNLKT